MQTGATRGPERFPGICLLQRLQRPRALILKGGRRRPPIPAEPGEQEPWPTHDAVLVRGRRVRVPLRGAAYAFSNRVGTIVGPAPINAGYGVVRLDEPAIYTRLDGRLEALLLVIEPGDTLEVLS